MIYDGANAYLRVGNNWTGFFLGDPAGPRVVNDPLWPLDGLFGARDGVEIGSEAVRGVAATRYRLTLDMAAADAALSAGVTVPALPYRTLIHMPAEVSRLLSRLRVPGLCGGVTCGFVVRGS